MLVVGWSDGDVTGHDVNTGDLLWSKAEVHGRGVSVVRVNRNGTYVATGGLQGEVKVFELSTGTMLCYLKDHKQKVTGIEVFDDNVHLLSCSADKSIVTWDLKVYDSYGLFNLHKHSFYNIRPRCQILQSLGIAINRMKHKLHDIRSSEED